MTSFDWIVVIVVGLSTLLAFFRGVIRELIALIAWIVGVIGAIMFAPSLGAMLPMPEHPAVPYVIAFALILIAALLVGALIAWPLAKAVRAAGLGFVDRFHGSIFGVIRGIVFLLAFVLVAGLTTLPAMPWWQRSAFIPPLVAGVLALRPYLPPDLASRLDFSPSGTRPKAAPVEQQA
jgi:membrane protein required for colicin V production